MTRKAVGLVVIAVLCVILALVGYQEFDRRQQEELNRKRAQQIARELNAERELSEKLARADKDMARVPPAYPHPVSAWRAAEKAFYERLLSKGRFDTLVVPFQVQDHAVARDIRSLMTAQLALAVAAASGGKASIPDPYLVGRALGEERRLELMNVFRLANQLNVGRVILGYVGHNGKNEMRLTLHYYDKAPSERFWETHAPAQGKWLPLIASTKLHGRHFEKLAYSDLDTPIDAFDRVLPEVLEFLGLDRTAARPAAVASSLEPATLPASALAMTSGSAEAARDAYYFQLLAALAPASAERVRERLTEKSMLAVRRMSAESPDYRALKARALMSMGLRPAALKALGTPVSAEEKHLLGMLNGNLPEVQAAKPLVPAGVRAVIAALEENAMAAAYRARTQKSSLAQVAALKLPGDAWQLLAARAMTDWDLWTQHENILLKALLDQEFPIEGSTAQALVQGAPAVGDMSKVQAAADLSVLDHVRRQIESAAGKWCCEPLAARPGAMDYLDLLEAIGTDNLVRRADFLTLMQDRPQSTIQFLARIDSAYKDHPQLALCAAKAQMALSKTAQGAEREGLLRSAYAGAFNAAYWEQGQTRTAGAAFEQFISQAGPQHYGGYDNFYANDYPLRSFFPYWQQTTSHEMLMRNARTALNNSAFDFTPMERIEWVLLGRARNRWDEVDQLLRSIEHRFVGHPERVAMMAQSSLRRGDVQAAQNHYREGIRNQPGNEQLHAELGKLLFENGEAQKSADVLMSYPGLKSRSGINPVGLSNYAYTAGSLYYWIGDFKRAIPFYRAAAELRTGSGASISSLWRLQLIDGDYLGALSGTLEAAQRYSSPQAYRDHFGLLHAMGQSQQAWDGFKAIVQIDAPHVWETALVGHQREGASESQIGTWSAQEPMRSAGKKQGYAAMYVLRAGLTDRIPTNQLPALIAALERPVWRLENQYRDVVRQSGGGGIDHAILGPNSPDAVTVPRGALEGTKKARVKSDLVYTAEAYGALRSGEFASARGLLQEAAGLYDTRNESLGYLLPYYAFAAARSNDTAAVEALLEKFTSQYRRFDYHLAKAVLAGIAGSHDEAARHANLALYRRSFTEDRPIFPEYQFAEICEWLFEATRNPRYRALALDWARKNQVFQPWFAWAYAIEAKLSTNPHERRRAIALAYYLDRNSARLARLPQGEVKAAVKEYAGRNPFLRPDAQRRYKEKA
jgi:hypothetical protein